MLILAAATTWENYFGLLVDKSFGWLRKCLMDREQSLPLVPCV